MISVVLVIPAQAGIQCIRHPALDSRLRGKDGTKAIAALGHGHVAEEALAIAVYCALVAKDFAHGVLLAVNHDGNSGATGAITGNLLGTLLGEAAIPESWLAPLELRSVLAEIAGDLHAFADWDIGSAPAQAALTSRISRKYPGI